MGLWNWLGRMTSTPDVPEPRATFSSVPMPIDQMFLAMRGGNGPVGREEALSVPAVQKARNLLCSMATLPLVQKDAVNNVVRNPLLEQFDPDVPNVVHLAQTIEDLVFEAIAWWRITGFGYDMYPTTVRRLEPSSVSLHPPSGRGTPAPLPSGEDPRGAVVWVDGEEVSVSEIVRFDSPNPAVLRTCARSIRRAIRFDKAAERYARNPRPLDYFTPTDGVDPVEDEEIEEILGGWAQSRQTESTAYVPAALTYNTVDVATPADLQLVELQKQAGLDLANALGVDPEDLGISTTSRTYANVIDRRRDRINDVLAPYMRAITDRLTMPDVTKRGYRVEFNLDDYLKSNPTERWATYTAGKNLGVYTAPEIRQMEGLPPVTDPAEPEPAAEPAGDEEPVDELVDAVEADRPAQHTFDTTLTFLDCATEDFTVDQKARTIEGLIVPWGRSAKGFRFERGAITWSDVTRVKLLRDHDFRQALGVATEITDTARGLRARFKVARGADGDRALELAEDGVLDGLSIGVDFDYSVDTVPDPKNKAGRLVQRSDLRETSLTPMPAFDDARVTRVAASRDNGGTMDDETATSGTSPAAGSTTTDPQTTPAAPVNTFTAEQVAEFSAAELAAFKTLFGKQEDKPVEPEARPVVDATRPTVAVRREALPYRFDRGGNFVTTDHVFSADLHEMALANDRYGVQTDAGKRVMALLRATFDVDSGDINELNPNIQRPDMYVDQRDYRTPLWNFVNKGAPPNGIQPFTFPKFNTATGLVGDHTEGVEPTSGTFTTTGQTVTPTALSGKASITREVWDMGGNPAVSTLIYNQMVRGYREGLESATATFLNTLTAATDILLPAGSADEALQAAWDAAVADLQFIRGYDFEAFALEKELYKKFVAAVDDVGRKLYAQINPQNANGQASRRFVTLDLAGVIGVPSWALPSTAGSPNNSWLFDPMVVHGWATTPQRLEFPGTAAATTEDPVGSYAPVAMVDIAIWGYKAFANSDIGGVRQVIYDTTA
jgi:HK97 family phage prohead protease